MPHSDAMLARLPVVFTHVAPESSTALTLSATDKISNQPTGFDFMMPIFQEKFGRKPQQLREWFDDADGWVIAHAFAEEGGVVVIEEYEKATNKSKIKVPRPCKIFIIARVNNTALMLRRLKADFSKSVTGPISQSGEQFHNEESHVYRAA